MPLNIHVLVKQIPKPPRSTLAGLAPAPHIDPLLILNPPDRAALEQALLLQKSAAAQVTAVTLGPPQADAVLRECLAAGADSALHLLCQSGQVFSLSSTAGLLAAALQPRCPGLVLCGMHSLDEGTAGLAAFLAEALGCQVASRVGRVNLAGDPDRVLVTRLLERGSRETLEMDLPAVLAISPLANQPRYISVYRRQLAAALPIETIPISAEPSGASSLQRVDLGPPRQRPRRLPRPAASLGASQRLSFMMAGGQAKKESALFEGAPAQAAERIFRYLQDEGLLGFR